MPKALVSLTDIMEEAAWNKDVVFEITDNKFILFNINIILFINIFIYNINII